MTWPLVLLDSVAERGSGHTPSQKHPEYWNGGIKWVSLADSHALDQGYIHKTAKKISTLGIRHSSAVLHPAGTVILSRDAGVGKSAILGDEMAVSQHFIAWRCDESKISAQYLYQWLQFEKPEFERMATGSTVKTIGLGYFQKLRIPLPPIGEQRAISKVLNDWDFAIQKTEQLITAKERSLQALMRKVLHKVHHPTRRLSAFTHRVTRKNTDGNGHPLTISGADGLVSQSQYYGKRIAADSAEHYTLIKRGEFAYNRSSSSGYPFGAIKRLDVLNEGVVSTLYLCFALNEDAPLSDYFSYYCESGGFNRQIYQVAQEGARNHGLLNVTAEDFFSMAMPIPSLEEQARVVTVLNAATGELSLLKRKLSALREQKRGLMQKLLAGQWQLPIPTEAKS